MPYNSALPDSLVIHSQILYSQLPPMEANGGDTCMEQLSTRFPPQDSDVITFYYPVILLPRATFSNRCLQLLCIVSSITRTGVQELGGSPWNLYRAMVSLLGRAEFRTVCAMSLTKTRNIGLVHPWIRDLHDPLDGFVSD